MHKFVIVVPSFNNSQWYLKNLPSICSQQYPEYRIIYIDDASTDNTGNLVQNYITKNNVKNITLLRNTQRKGALENLYYAIHGCQDEEIIITVDGDDWLAHPQVLQKLDKVYSDPNIWMTYGQYRSHPDNRIGCSRPIPDSVAKINGFRDHPWSSSHLRTFYTWLFKKIKMEDLQQDHHFYPVAWDVSFMMPMLEMSGYRSKCITDVLYMYNIATPINDFKLRLKEQQDTDAAIRLKPRYQPL